MAIMVETTVRQEYKDIELIKLIGVPEKHESGLLTVTTPDYEADLYFTQGVGITHCALYKRTFMQKDAKFAAVYSEDKLRGDRKPIKTGHSAIEDVLVWKKAKTAFQSMKNDIPQVIVFNQSELDRLIEQNNMYYSNIITLLANDTNRLSVDWKPGKVNSLNALRNMARLCGYITDKKSGNNIITVKELKEHYPLNGSQDILELSQYLEKGDISLLPDTTQFESKLFSSISIILAPKSFWSSKNKNNARVIKNFTLFFNTYTRSIAKEFKLPLEDKYSPLYKAFVDVHGRYQSIALFMYHRGIIHSITDEVILCRLPHIRKDCKLFLRDYIMLVNGQFALGHSNWSILLERFLS